MLMSYVQNLGLDDELTYFMHLFKKKICTVFFELVIPD